MGQTTQLAPAQPPADNKPATLAQSQRQSVQRYGDDRALALEMRSLRRSLPNLASADDADLGALVIAARWSGLNPYAGEIYLIPGIGVMTASKIKAADAVAAAAKRGDTLAISFDRVVQGTTLYDELSLEAGDVAFQCRIISSKSRLAWYQHRLAVVEELRAMGYSRPEMEARLSEMFPNAPEYTAVGVVKARENFGEGKKAEMFSRSDRARKRALIKCLNINGLASPDQRNYGGVQINQQEEPVEGQYTINPVKTPAEIKSEIDPEFAAAVSEAEEEAALRHKRNAHALGRDEAESLIPDAKPAAPAQAAPAQSVAPADTDANSATDAKARIGKWSAKARIGMANAPIDIAAKISAALSVAEQVVASRQATIGDLNRAANILRDLCSSGS